VASVEAHRAPAAAQPLVFDRSPWTEYKTDGGIPYWYNSETKVSVWTEPEEVKLAKAMAKAGPQPGQPQGLPAAPPASVQQPAQPSGPAAGERPADSQPGRCTDT